MPTKTLPAKNGRAKTGVRTAARKRTTAARPTTAAPVSKPAPSKTAKIKVVRDSFTIPGAEYASIGELKRRAAGLGRPVKKSEVLRAGLKLLAAMTVAQLLAAMTAVPSIKTGRPKGKKASKPAEAAPAALSA